MPDLRNGLIVLHGANGAGKTNILEALSLLSPGRGLRGVKPIAMQCRNAGLPWAVSAQVAALAGEIQIGTGLDPKNEKRVLRINGETLKSQSALADHMACLWLTPQMDRLFIDSAGERRRFLDRMVAAFDPGHARTTKRYENAMAQRSRLLKESRMRGVPPDDAWLAALESHMAETGIAIAAARIDFCRHLQQACDRNGGLGFPRARMRVKGSIESLIGAMAALEAEDMFKYQLHESRARDSVAGGAASGPHKSDMDVIYAEKNMAAAHCSTGEQKALLIGIVLAHAHLMKSEKGRVPVLLLDEIAAHLDENRRGILYETLQSLGGQAWLTGTDRNLFSSIENAAQVFYVENAHVEAASGGNMPVRAA